MLLCISTSQPGWVGGGVQYVFFLHGIMFVQSMLLIFLVQTDVALMLYLCMCVDFDALLHLYYVCF